MPSSPIFKSECELSPKYVPSSLPHREKQIGFLLNLYLDSLENLQEDYLFSSQLVGPVGAGKTVRFFDKSIYKDFISIPFFRVTRWASCLSIVAS